MAERLNRGEIWLLLRARPDKRRPVLVLSRPSLIQLLHTVTVAAITSTLRGAPREVELGIPEGLKATSCVNLCNLFTVHQQELTTFVGTVPPDKMAEVCRALTIACACDLPQRVTGAVGDNRTDQLWFHNPEVAERIARAEEELATGRSTRTETPDEAQAFLDDLKRPGP
jgi:mRNA interferase MazF